MRPAHLWLFAILVLPGCSKLTGYNEVLTSSHAKYADASTQDGMRRGWLPRDLPPSATDIVEVHNIDSSETWIRFKYGQDGIDSLLRHCTAHPPPTLPDKRRTRRNVPWWPQPLVSGNEGATDVSRWELHSCPAMRHAGLKKPAGMAVERTSRTVWYWVY